MTDAEQVVPPGVDATRPSAARLYDYYLGGTDNFEIDRKAAEQIRAVMPELADAAWANRGFLQRAASWLAGEAGIRQFIDIGAGLPTRNNTHEAVQKIAPDARVVYVDNDPMVRAHAQDLLAGATNCAFITGDLRDPTNLLKNHELLKLIDFGEPVALMMVAVLHFVSDEHKPTELIGRYLNETTPGSYLAATHATADMGNPDVVERGRQVYANANEQIHLRSKPEFERFFAGLRMVPPYAGARPGVSYVGLWGAEDPEVADDDGSRWFYCGVARKP